MEKNQRKKNVNLYKYAFVVLLICFFWGFVGGIIIALNRDEMLKIGALVAFLGMLLTFFLFDFLVKKKKWKWIHS